MFEKGDVVICGTSGICEINDISTLDMEGVQKDRMYFILHPRNEGGTIYVPVDNASAKIRKVISKQEAMELIAKMPEIEPLDGCNEKFLEESYKKSLRKFDCVEWVRLIKYIYFRKQSREGSGKKVTAVDERYMRLAENILYQEIGEAIGMPKEQVLDYISDQIENKKMKS